MIYLYAALELLIHMSCLWVQALFESAASAGIGKINQISEPGVDDLARSGFHRSKLVADRFFAHLSVPYVILRPSLVYGPGDHSMAFFSRLCPAMAVIACSRCTCVTRSKRC